MSCFCSILSGTVTCGYDFSAMTNTVRHAYGAHWSSLVFSPCLFFFFLTWDLWFVWSSTIKNITCTYFCGLVCTVLLIGLMYCCPKPYVCGCVCVCVCVYVFCVCVYVCAHLFVVFRWVHNQRHWGINWWKVNPLKLKLKKQNGTTPFNCVKCIV